MIDYHLHARVEEQAGNKITSDDVVKRYPDLVGPPLGTFQRTIRLVTDAEAKPKPVTSCRVQVIVKPQLATTFKHIEVKGVVAKVEEPTP